MSELTLSTGVCARFRFFAVILAMGAGTVWSPDVLRSDDDPLGWIEPVIRVEEDWVLVLNEPNESMVAPQFHTVMSAFDDLDSYFAQVTWNYHELSDFAAGGLQVQMWQRGDVVDYRSFVSGVNMSTVAETVSWTQVMKTNGTSLTFLITNGTGTTWGAFGYPSQEMRVSQSVPVSNLNEYTTAVSAGNSQITFGSNRVASLVITEVRRYGESGLIAVDTTPKVIHQID